MHARHDQGIFVMAWQLVCSRIQFYVLEQTVRLDNCLPNPTRVGCFGTQLRLPREQNRTKAQHLATPDIIGAAVALHAPLHPLAFK